MMKGGLNMKTKRISVDINIEQGKLFKMKCASVGKTQREVTLRLIQGWIKERASK